MKKDRRGDEITPQSPEWAFEGRVPRGAITLIVGRDGTGKSTLVCGLAAAWTKGELTARPERVHLALAEDDVAAVTVPRLLAAGADMRLVRLPAQGEDWILPRDCAALRDYILAEEIQIVVLDPLDHYVRVNGAKARQELDALRDVAESTGAAIVCVHHFTKVGKSVDEAIGGGRAVKAVARSILVWGPVVPEPLTVAEALGFDRDDESEEEEDNLRGRECGALGHHKNSYDVRQPTLLYARDEAEPPGFAAVGDCELTVTDVFTGTPLSTPDHARKWEIARDLVVRFLAGSERTGEDLASDVMAAGISQTTFERARAELAREGVIEQFQRERRHWWRIAVPTAPPGGVE